MPLHLLRSKNICHHAQPVKTTTRVIVLERNRLNWKQHVQRVTGKADPGHFAVMFKNTKTKEDIERLWVSKVRKGI